MRAHIVDHPRVKSLVSPTQEADVMVRVPSVSPGGHDPRCICRLQATGTDLAEPGSQEARQPRRPTAALHVAPRPERLLWLGGGFHSRPVTTASSGKRQELLHRLPGSFKRRHRFDAWPERTAWAGARLPLKHSFSLTLLLSGEQADSHAWILSWLPGWAGGLACPL